jgi:predicted phage baseplate assembly protein
MSPLAPNLFERRFSDLMEIGLAKLPSLAPEWTDHNAHDPGITLMELLAWTAEAQLFALSRLRRDERVAYAAMLGLTSAGTQGATGLIWPDPLDPNSPVATFARSVVIGDETVINVVTSETPTFRPTHKLVWAPGQIEQLETRGPGGGGKINHTAVNRRGDLAFMPFGERSGRRSVLSLTFQCRDDAGLFGTNRQNTKGALWPIGVMAAPPSQVAASSPASVASEEMHAHISATLVTESERFPLRIASDSTRGFLGTGVILLDLDNVTLSPRNFSIEFRSPGGFPRPPRVLRVQPNVVPVRQGLTIFRELQVATGEPDWSFQLGVPGLRFAEGEEPIKVEVAEAGGLSDWSRCDRLSDHGPDETVYELDLKKSQVTFGNGINGRIPPAQSQVFATYSVSDGEAGSVARNRKWSVGGFAGTFGLNPDPMSGGAETFGGIEQRREARRRSRDDHALVSSNDIVAAAKVLPLLEVARAWIPAPDDKHPRTGVVTLIALRSRPDGLEPEEPPETRLWLEGIRSQLAPRIPLGTRLVVKAPRYVEFTIHAVLESELGRDASAIKRDVETALQERLMLVDSPGATSTRLPGIPLTRRDVAAWLRTIDGVKRVAEVQLRGADGKNKDTIVVPRSGLPRWNSTDSTIEVNRPQPGRPR